jgi:hypothetical protein
MIYCCLSRERKTYICLLSEMSGNLPGKKYALQIATFVLYEFRSWHKIFTFGFRDSEFRFIFAKFGCETKLFFSKITW